MVLVSLINPIFENMGQPPLGLAYIGAYLERFNIKVRIIDTSFEDLNNILKGNPRIVGIYSMTPYFNSLVHTIQFIKNHITDAIVVVGGPHASVQPFEVLNIPGVDYVVIGEGEVAFLELVQALTENGNVDQVKGIGFIREKRIHITPPNPPIEDLDKLPFPARHLLPIEKYMRPFTLQEFNFLPIRATTMIASRGCVFNCVFCQPTLRKIFGVKTRYRSPENVLDEMKLLKEEYGAEGILFVDDTFTLNREWVKMFCKKNNLGLKLAINSRIDTVDESMLQEMKKAGVISILFGIESGNQRILNNLRKGITISQIENTVRKTKKVGFFVKGYFMIGAPGDTKETISQTISFAKTLPLDQVQFSIATPYPGTELYEMAVRNGWIENLEGMKTMGYFKSAVMRTDSLSSNQIKSIHKVQCKPLVIEKQIISCCKRIPKILTKPSYIPHLFLQGRKLIKYLTS